MALYAWNSAPVIDTDISRSLLVVGREFQFPINYSSDEHLILTSDPNRVQSFASEQVTLLCCGRLVGQELIHQHRAWHREYINSQRPNPRIYSDGDMVYAKRAVRSDKKHGLVGKLMDAWTGPRKITSKAKGSSYNIEHHDTKRVGKRHAAHISPFPLELLPFLPVDGPDNRFGQIHRPIQKDAYQNAGIKGFVPPVPIKFAIHGLLATGAPDPEVLCFPNLSELNAELADWSDAELSAINSSDALCTDLEVFAATTAPAPPAVAPELPSVPSLPSLTTSILASSDKLFFISHRVPGSSLSEWCLVRVALQDSTRQHPSCFQDGCFLVDFYTCHPSDKLFNAINQHYWLEYYPINTLHYLNRQRTTHLICPSNNSPTYARAEGLTSFQQLVC